MGSGFWGATLTSLGAKPYNGHTLLGAKPYIGHTLGRYNSRK